MTKERILKPLLNHSNWSNDVHIAAVRSWMKEVANPYYGDTIKSDRDVWGEVALVAHEVLRGAKS